MRPDKLLSLLGLATKAGKVCSGEFMCEKSIKSGRAQLLIISDDASDNTGKKFSDMCTFYGVKFYTYGDSEVLGHAIGKAFRKVIGIEDPGFAESIGKLIEEKVR